MMAAPRRRRSLQSRKKTMMMMSMMRPSDSKRWLLVSMSTTLAKRSTISKSIVNSRRRTRSANGCSSSRDSSVRMSVRRKSSRMTMSRWTA